MGVGCGIFSKGKSFDLDELSAMPHTVTMQSEAPKSRYLVDMTPEARSQFIARLYLVAAAQAIVTATVSFPVAILCSQAWLVQHLWLYYLAMSGLIAVFVGTPMLFERSVRIHPCGLIFLAVLALLAGLIAGIGSAAFAVPWLTIAVGDCVVGLSGLATFVLLTGSDFTSITPYFFATCFGMVVLGVVLSIAMPVPTPTPCKQCSERYWPPWSPCTRSTR